MKHLKKFNEKSIIIDGETYVIKPANIDIEKFNYEGQCDEYKGSYVIIDGEEDPRVRIFDGSIFDDNNHRSSFDPQNYSDAIHCRLEHGDECYLEDLYEIISTTNKTGEVYYAHLDDSSKDWNKNWTFGLKNGISIHNDLIEKSE